MKTISASPSPQAVDVSPSSLTHPTHTPLQILSRSTPDLQNSFLQARPVLSRAQSPPEEVAGDDGLALGGRVCLRGPSVTMPKAAFTPFVWEGEIFPKCNFALCKMPVVGRVTSK